MFASGRTPMSSIDHCVDHPLGSGLSDGRRKPVSWRSSGQVIEETGKGNALFTMIEKRIAITGFTECHVVVDFFFPPPNHFLLISIYICTYVYIYIYIYI